MRTKKLTLCLENHQLSDMYFRVLGSNTFQNVDYLDFEKLNPSQKCSKQIWNNGSDSE